MGYKYSRYNHFINKNDIVFIGGNLVKSTIFALSKNNYELLQLSPKDLKKQNIHLFNAMLKLGVIIPSNISEINNLIKLHRIAVYASSSYKLTIIPTLECNVNCWYCYEEHKKGYMSDEIINNIYSFIKNKIINIGLKSINIDWFGGEPLLYFDEILYPLSKRIQELCLDNKVWFTNSITTNGILIDSNMVKKMNEIELNSFQITLDGGREQHNLTRKIKNEDSFQKIIDNTIELLKNDIKVCLRINYTHKNVASIPDIIPLIPKQYRSKLDILFQQVWQTTDKGDINVDSYKKSFVDEGYSISDYKLNDISYKCYADLLNQAVILPDGKVFKCTARDFANYVEDGILVNDEILWNNIHDKRMSKTTIENPKCKQCSVLPACWGPCSQKVIETNAKDFERICNKGGVIQTIERQYNLFYEKNIKSIIEIPV